MRANKWRVWGVIAFLCFINGFGYCRIRYSHFEEQWLDHFDAKLVLIVTILSLAALIGCIVMDVKNTSDHQRRQKT